MSRSSRYLAIVATLAAWGCQVDWGGASIELDNPAPPPDTTAAIAEELEPEQIALPDGPHIYAVRLDSRGDAQIVPLAGIDADAEAGSLALEDIAFPEADDPSFRGRFDSVFLAPGTELELLARGARLGSLILDGVGGGTISGCPSMATGRALLVPGQDVPPFALAVPAGVSGFDGASRVTPVEATTSMGVAGPVLAERLIGGDRAFLARLQQVTPIALAGDTLAGMAATWMVADSLAVGPPGDRAASLFFLARFEPTRGFIPVWEEVRRYSDPSDKEAFAWVDWITLGEHRLDVVRRYDAASIQLAFSVTSGDEERGIDWTEPAACPTVDRLGAR